MICLLNDKRYSLEETRLLSSSAARIALELYAIARTARRMCHMAATQEE